ncbi:hypothetical protein ACIBXA_31490 [Micromonospora echinaurantiaca]|uniref:hypothetical protein n=1 Tax=Micromonospora echinaurantiaca TaxID=47857 RepID=UPI0037A6E6CF
MRNQSGEPTPVFVDGTGRRRRVTVIAGSAMGVGLLASLALILAGLFLDTSVSVPGWSDDRPPAGVDGRAELGEASLVTPGPSPVTGTSAPAPTGSPTPGARPTSVPSAGHPTASERPGLGDERRDNTGKPSKSPGKPR